MENSKFNKSKTLNLRINPKLKKQAESILSKLGIPMSVAIDMYLEKIVLYQGIPFEITLSKSSKLNNKTNILTIKQIKKIIKPILAKYGIKDICLFGSYARGEATNNSDIDIYCEKGNIKTLFQQNELIDELKKSLNKDVDVIFYTSRMDNYYKKQITEDMINLC